jgi:adenylate cyclase
MPQKNDILTILFADISGSTTLYETLGDEAAHGIIEDCLSMLTVTARLHDGKIIKAMGDGIMCSFNDAADAVESAVAMNQSIDRLADRKADRHIVPDIRIGFHTGQVILDGNDIFGDTVNVAARMASLAKPRQIVTTKLTVDGLPEYLKEKCEFFDRTTIKGKGGEFDIYEIVWEESNRTLIMKAEHSEPEHEKVMNIVSEEKKVRVDKSTPTITIGRQEHNTITVDNSMVSRSHCKIEYRKGKFIFIDQSSNGSYIHNESGYTAYVHNDESVLGNSGYICLGHDGRQDSRLSISFRLIRKIR